jgi:malate synthase
LTTSTDTPPGVELHIDARAASADLVETVLTYEALAFVADLDRAVRLERATQLRRRQERKARIAAGELPDFAPETRDVRESDWRVPPPPPGLVDRRVEITGPTDRRMAVNALNSGARVWMADFEDATSPTIGNLLDGQANLQLALSRQIDFETDDGRRYQLVEQPATMVIRPRGWHLDERHVFVDGVPMSASLFDFGLYVFHASGPQNPVRHHPYFYLPKLESHREARLWNQVFCQAEDYLSLARGEIRATVLIETILAAFEMHEILFELGEHAAGLNAGRWDYLFSIVKKLHDAPGDFLLPDRNSVTMTAPFMRAYADLLVATCHRRGAYAIGGMAAFIPSRRDAAVNEAALAKVREDKEREAQSGFDGSWVAHPDLVKICDEAFAPFLGERLNQLDQPGVSNPISAAELLDVASTPGRPTAAGLENNVSVSLQYLTAWLSGQGAVAIYNLMEDAATAEISRSQIWQWLQAGVVFEDGTRVTESLVRAEIDRSVAALELANPRDIKHLSTARSVLESLVFAEQFSEFLTTMAYTHLDD